MFESTKLRIVLMGQYGFHAHTIQKQVKKYDGESFSLSAIYSTLRKNGIKLKDYRDGIGDIAETMIDKICRRGDKL